MYSYITTALAMAASVSALPAISLRQYAASTLGLTVQLNGTRVPLGYSFNGTENAILVADASLPPAAFYEATSTSTTAKALEMIIDGVEYGIIAGNLGVGSGRRQPVFVEQGEQEFAWLVSTEPQGPISHNLTHADEYFVVCESVVDGKSAYVLNWASENLDGNYLPCITSGLYRS